MLAKLGYILSTKTYLKYTHCYFYFSKVGTVLSRKLDWCLVLKFSMYPNTFKTSQEHTFFLLLYFIIFQMLTYVLHPQRKQQ